jgi:hypothetical protein
MWERGLHLTRAGIRPTFGGSSVATALPLESRSPAENKPAIFGTASLFFAILTIALPVLMMICFGQKADQAEHDPNQGGWGGLAAIFLLLLGVAFAGIVSGLSSVVGTVTGVVALVRGESHMWRPIVGLIVNAPVLVFVAFTAIVLWMNSGG